MSVLQILSLLTKIATDPNLQAAIAKFVEFIRGLTEEERAAYLSKFASVGGYGSPCCPDPDCPSCPDDCCVVEEALLETLGE